MNTNSSAVDTIRTWSDELGLGSSYYASEAIHSGLLDATSVVTIATWWADHHSMDRLAQGYAVPKDDLIDSLNDIECGWLSPLESAALGLMRKFIANF